MLYLKEEGEWDAVASVAGSAGTYPTCQPYTYTANGPYFAYSLVAVPLYWDGAVSHG